MNLRCQTVLALLTCALLSGCVSTGDDTGGIRSVQSGEGLPLLAAFIYTEDVHGVRFPFSVEESFWESIFPQAAKAFEQSRRYDNRDAAVYSDADVVIHAKNTVHGTKKKFKLTLVVTVRDRDGKLLAETAYRDRPVTAGKLETTFRTIGSECRDDLRKNRTLQRLAGVEPKKRRRKIVMH